MTPDMQRLVNSLMRGLDASKPDLHETPLGRLLSEHIAALISRAKADKATEAELYEAEQAYLEYENLRGRS